MKKGSMILLNKSAYVYKMDRSATIRFMCSCPPLAQSLIIILYGCRANKIIDVKTCNV